MIARAQHKRTAKAALALLLILLPLITQPISLGKVDDLAEVSPGKIPPSERDDYLGNASVRVRLDYPKSFILQETVGDLVFNITVRNTAINRTDILIPPEFGVNLDTTYVWTGINNSYSSIRVTQLDAFDNVAPKWYDISITNFGNNTQPNKLVSATSWGTIWCGSHTIRIFNVTAPSIAGQYFFKVLTDEKSIGNRNFPSVVVSAHPDPCHVSGIVRYGGSRFAKNYGLPIKLNKGEGGKVQATGVTDDGRIVIGQAFFNHTANGNYTIYGLAPGRYSLNATASAYAPGELPHEIILKAGQSIDGVDIFLERSSVIEIRALSRYMKQPEPWGYIYNFSQRAPRRITLEILDIWNTTLYLQNNTDTNPGLTYHDFAYVGQRDLDGHIPQENSSYVGGIAPGRYYIRIWANGYIQSSALNERALTNECAVAFSRNEQDRKLDILLEKTGTLRVLVHFTNSTRNLSEDPIPPVLNGATLIVEAYDLGYSDTTARAMNTTRVSANDRTASIELTGLFRFGVTRKYGYSNFSRDYGLPPGEYVIFARLILRGFGGFVYGAPLYVSVGNIYLPSVYIRGPTGHRVIIGEGRNEISFFMVPQGRLRLTIWPVTSQKPFSIATWRYPYSGIRVEIRDRNGVEVYWLIVSRFAVQKSSTGSSGVIVDILPFADEGIYSIWVFTYGYVQKQPVLFHVKRGEIADASIYMIEGIKIDLTLVFQKERIFDKIDNYYSIRFGGRIPIRVEVYNRAYALPRQTGFAGASVTYVDTDSSTKRGQFNITVAGFKSYYGGNATRWVNYFDTTDSTGQNDCGLGQDVYWIKVYVPGYEQLVDPIIDARPRANMTVSVVLSLRRMGHLTGRVYAYTERFLNYTRISWASIDAIGKEATVTGNALVGTNAPDGFYDMWLTPGIYRVIVSLPAYQTQSIMIQIPDGSDINYDFWLLPLGMKMQGRYSSLIGPPNWQLMTDRYSGLEDLCESVT